MDNSRATSVRRVLSATVFTLLLACVALDAQTDPLPSWNDGAAKQAIINFVRATIFSFDL
jgi:hypothetical protein